LKLGPNRMMARPKGWTMSASRDKGALTTGTIPCSQLANRQPCPAYFPAMIALTFSLDAQERFH
jgi:hypothetical protein